MSINPFKKPNLKLKSFTYLESSKSASSTPRVQQSFDLSSRDQFNLSNQQTINKSAITGVLKNLEELGNNLEIVIKRLKNYDRDVFDLVKNCERKLTITKQKVIELSSDENSSKLSESNGLQEISTILKPEVNEYCKFLEHLLGYEQVKSEIIMKKSKYL